MSITKVKNNNKPEMSKMQTKWDEAIADAEEKIRRLRYSISVFKARKEAGDVWPERGAETHN